MENISKLPRADEAGISAMRVEMPDGRNAKVLAVASFNYYGVILTGVELRRGKLGLFLKYPGRAYYPCNSAVKALHQRVIIDAYRRQFPIRTA